MKKLIFFLLIITTLSSCYVERRTFVHRHPWTKSYRAHRYYTPRLDRKYVAPNRMYHNRGF